jgi:hypothetical protein
MDARERPPLEVTLELERDADTTPPHGWLRTGAAPPRRFESYVQLIAMLEQVRRGAPGG